MSCAALTVLYTAQYIKNKQEYLDYAEKILTIHDAFTVFTPHPVMFRSIWRAEAEYRYALLTHDDARLLDSYNCFMTNLATEDADGHMYAIYQYEPIPSGALAENGKEVDFSDCFGFPRRRDVTLSRYVFARGYDTWLTTVAVLPDRVIGGYRKGNEIIPLVDDFTTL